MRIAVITSSYPRFAGDSTAPFVRSLAEELARRGHQVDVAAPYDISVVPEAEAKVKVWRFPYILPKKWHILGHARSLEADAHLRPLAVILLPFFLLSGFFCLLKVTRRQKSEVIHAHWLLPNGLVAAWVAKLRKIPFVVSLHGSDMFVAGKNPLFKWTARWILKRAEGVSACSEELFDRAEALGAGAKINVIAWGANPDCFKPVKNKAGIRQRYGWGENELVICSLGRMVYKKGFDRLVGAFANLKAERDDLRLVIGGEGPVRAELLEQAQRLGIENRLNLPGRIAWDNVADFLGAADIFVLPSVRDLNGNLDGLPTVLLEAMACGLPCIASEIGGVNLVIRDGENGLLVQPNSIPELESALRGLIFDRKKRKQLGEAARRDVIECFNWEHVAIEFEVLLRDAIFRHHKPRLGQLYRIMSLPHMIPSCDQARVLDLGCHDGSWLDKLQAGLRVGVDLNPGSAPKGVTMVKADVCQLPFKEDAFGAVYALDLIEHLEDETSLAAEICRVLERDGRLILTTPAEDIQLFPRFLTAWVSKVWGHVLRRGYAPRTLEKYFKGSLAVQVRSWRARAYLEWYLVLRLLYQINPRSARKCLKRVVEADSRKLWGEGGFLLLEGTKMLKKGGHVHD